MSDTAHTATLDVLRCPGCNAPVPLGDADEVVCRYCGVAFPVPEEHRELRDAERRRAAERDEAHALYRTLGRPPSVVARAWGEVAVGCVWIFLWPFALVFDAFLIAKLLEVVSRSIHATLVDVLPGAVVWGGIGAAMYATLAVPLALGVYGSRRTKARRKLQAALAALPPDREGGPARCHSCGAPLDVGPSDLGLACVYCGADNLVRMPERWIASLREKTKRLDTGIESAGREDRQMRAMVRKSLRRQLAWLFVFVPVMAAWGVVIDRDADAYPPNWRSAVAGDRELLPVAPDVEDYDRYAPPPLSANGSPRLIAFDRAEKHGDSYFRSYYLPLRYGETVAFASGEFPDAARALGFVFRTQESVIFGDDWRSVGRTVILYPHGSATFAAPRSAWYRVDVLMLDDIPPGQLFEIRVSIAPS
jgi:hypothetical protein